MLDIDDLGLYMEGEHPKDTAGGYIITKMVISFHTKILPSPNILPYQLNLRLSF